MKTILHITTRAAWESAVRGGLYEAPSLAAEGFIHCSTLHQVVGTADSFFRGAQDLVLLVIDESAATAEVKYEPAADGGRAAANGLFPHLYGPLNLDAVIRVVDFPPGPDGGFSLPQSLRQ
jgi:uncharacterized protein (DUF952 family)